MNQKAKIQKSPESIQQYVERFVLVNAESLARTHEKRTGLKTNYRALGSRVQYLITNKAGERVTIYCIPNQ